jgi:hypothetical protein
LESVTKQRDQQRKRWGAHSDRRGRRFVRKTETAMAAEATAGSGAVKRAVPEAPYAGERPVMEWEHAQSDVSRENG